MDGYAIIDGRRLVIDRDAGIEDFYAGDGNDWVRGNDLANHLTGSRGEDTLDGAAGQNTLTGGAGGDAFRVEITIDGLPGSGQVGDSVVEDFELGTYRLQIDGPAFSDAGEVLSAFEDSDFGARIDFAGGGSLTLRGIVTADLSESDIELTDHRQRIGTHDADHLQSGQFGNIENTALYGGDGDDTLIGRHADEYLDGGNGNDTIEGKEGNDVLAGGDGDGAVDTTRVSFDNGATVDLLGTTGLTQDDLF